MLGISFVGIQHGGYVKTGEIENVKRMMQAWPYLIKDQEAKTCEVKRVAWTSLSSIRYEGQLLMLSMFLLCVEQQIKTSTT